MTVSFCMRDIAALHIFSCALTKLHRRPWCWSALMLEKRCYKNSNSRHAEIWEEHKHTTTHYYAVCPVGVKIILWIPLCWTRWWVHLRIRHAAKSPNDSCSSAGHASFNPPWFPWNSLAAREEERPGGFHIKHLTWPCGHQQQTHCCQ